MVAKWLLSGLRSRVPASELVYHDPGQAPLPEQGDATVGPTPPDNGVAHIKDEVFPIDAEGTGRDWDELDELGLAKQLRRVFGRSLHIRHIDVGSCNACESEVLAISNPYYNCHRLGIFFTASPRHADVLLVTGALTLAMKPVLEETYEAMPRPRIVITAGVCAFDGGLFAKSPQCLGSVDSVIPVDLHIHGCPPTPSALIRGILATVQRRSEASRHA